MRRLPFAKDLSILGVVTNAMALLLLCSHELLATTQTADRGQRPGACLDHGSYLQIFAHFNQLLFQKLLVLLHPGSMTVTSSFGGRTGKRDAERGRVSGYSMVLQCIIKF